MEICCGDVLVAKAEFECCAGAARPLTPTKRCCNKRDGFEDYDPSKGEKCCRGSDGLGLVATAEEKCCGAVSITPGGRVTCCGTGPNGKKYDARYEECCHRRGLIQIIDPNLEQCCGKEVTVKRKQKCLKNGNHYTSRPLTYLDLMLEGITPDWLKCSKARGTTQGVMPKSCEQPSFDWEALYDDDYDLIVQD